MATGTDVSRRRYARAEARAGTSPRPLREQLKGVAEALLAHGGPVDVALALTRSPGAVLAYHNVVPDGTPQAGDASLHVSLSDFRRQLDHLQRVYEVVPLNALLGERQGEGRRPRVAITFDDAYRGAVTLAAPELAQRGVPATIFVAPGLLGDRPFWWDRYGAENGVQREDWRERALFELGGDDRRIRRWSATLGLDGSTPDWIARSATLDELREASRLDGIWLGSHSWSHLNLTCMSPRALAEDLSAALGWLRARFDRVVPWLAYPYGIWNPRVRRVVEFVGHRGAVTVGTGILPRGETDPFLVPRVSVPAGLSIEGFMLRTAGLVSR